MNTIRLGDSLAEGQTKVSSIVSEGKEGRYRKVAMETGVSFTIKPYENYGAGACFEITLEHPDTEILRDCLNRTGDVFVVPIGT